MIWHSCWTGSTGLKLHNQKYWDWLQLRHAGETDTPLSRNIGAAWLPARTIGKAVTGFIADKMHLTRLYQEVSPSSQAIKSSRMSVERKKHPASYHQVYRTMFNICKSRRKLVFIVTSSSQYNDSFISPQMCAANLMFTQREISLCRDGSYSKGRLYNIAQIKSQSTCTRNAQLMRFLRWQGKKIWSFMNP